MKIKKVYEVNFCSVDDERRFFKFILNRYLKKSQNLKDWYLTTPTDGNFSFNFTFYMLDEITLSDLASMYKFFKKIFDSSMTIDPGNENCVIVRFRNSFQPFFDFLEIDYEKKTIDEIKLALDAKKYNL